MKIGVIIAIVLIGLVFISGCEVSDFLGITGQNTTSSFENQGNNSKETNNPPVIEDIKLKK